jgi:diadenosine tetraphosphate (Ap4A) HIT family hydrolase
MMPIRSNRPDSCPLCLGSEEEVLWRDGRCRVIDVRHADYPGYLRVIWNEHVAEMTDLDADDCAHLWRVLLGTERVLRRLMSPDKVNLASLGNMVPHLHWHVIPRYRDDAHFPDAIWAPPRRRGPSPHAVAHPPATLAAALRAELGGSGATVFA